MKYILTIDQSTFSTKVFIIDEESNMLASSSYQHQQYYPQNGWVEHDGEEIYTNLLKAVSTLKKEFPELVAKVASRLSRKVNRFKNQSVFLSSEDKMVD